MSAADVERLRHLLDEEHAARREYSGADFSTSRAKYRAWRQAEEAFWDVASDALPALLAAARVLAEIEKMAEDDSGEGHADRICNCWGCSAENVLAEATRRAALDKEDDG